MGLFGYNYAKEGPGVPKDAPKKKGVELFWDIIVNKIGKLIGINCLYALCALPVLFVYGYIASVWFSTAQDVIETAQINVLTLTVQMASLILLVLGGGIVMPGLVYIIRCFVRGEHAFIVSDFFEQIKKNIKQSLVVMIIDFVLLYLFFVDLNAFVIMPQISFLRIPLLLFALVYSIARMYLYVLMVTFEASLWRLWKTSFVLCFYKLPQNIGIMLISLGLYATASFFMPFYLVLFSIVCLVQTIYTYSVIEKTVDFGPQKEKPESLFDD